MIRLVNLGRVLGIAGGAAAIFAIPLSTGQGVAMAAASCNGITVRQTSTVTFVTIPSTSTGSGNYNCIAGDGPGGTVGTTGDGVRAIQKSLDMCKGAGLQQDGLYGLKTATAVAAQQKRENVPQDGVYGPVTRSHGFPMVGLNISTGVQFCTTAGF